MITTEKGGVCWGHGARMGRRLQFEMFANDWQRCTLQIAGRMPILRAQPGANVWRFSNFNYILGWGRAKNRYSVWATVRAQNKIYVLLPSKSLRLQSYVSRNLEICENIKWYTWEMSKRKFKSSILNYHHPQKVQKLDYGGPFNSSNC